MKWIQHDMNRKASTPPTQALVSQQSGSPFPQVQPRPKQEPGHSPITATPEAPVEQRNPSTNGGTFYDPATGESAAPFQSINYNDQVGSVGAPPASNGVGPGYPTADAGQLMVSAAGVTNVHALEQAASAANPLIAFASQATQHVAGQAGEDWRPHAQLLAQHSGNTWHDWTAAIADSQDRYSANALLTLGSARPSDVGATVDGVSQGEAIAATSHTSQWPLLLFNEPSGP